MGLKKLLATGVMVTGLLVITSPTTSAKDYSDTENHWAVEDIDKWSQHEIVKGYKDGAFKPNGKLTRAEFSMMLDNLMKYEAKGDNPFNDLGDGVWYTDSIIKLHTAGVLQGSNGAALPQSNITRQEAAQLISKAFKVKGGTSSPMDFKDVEEIAPWAKDAVSVLSSKEIIKGFPNGTFEPKGHLTRAQAVTILSNMIEKMVTTSTKVSEDIDGNIVVNAPDTFLKDMKIKGDLYIAPGVGDGEVTLDNVEIEGDVFVLGGGINSVIFNNVDVRGALVVNRHNGNIRILATGTTSIAVTKLESGALIVTKKLTGKGFETIEIPAEVVKGQKITLDGNFTKVINESKDQELTINGKVDEFVAKENSKIVGNATVSKVTSDNNAKTTVNNEAVTPITPVAPSTGGGSVGGGVTPSPEEESEVSTFIDPNFEDGYPKATLENGSVWVEFKLKEAAEVFMVANSINSHWKSTVQSVLDGHAGGNDDIIYVDEWPYFNVTDPSEVVKFDTGISFQNNGSANIEFVIKQDDRISEEVTRIVFGAEVVDAVQEYAPGVAQIAINKNQTEMYIYFYEELDSSSLPKKEDFVLSKGQVTNVEMDSASYFGGLNSYLKLAVKQIASDNTDSIQVEYRGTALQGKTGANKKVEPFVRYTNQSKTELAGVTLNSKRTNLTLRFESGWAQGPNHFDLSSLITIKVDGEEVPFEFNHTSTSNEYFEVMGTTETPLKEGEIEVFVNTEGLKNWAFDAYPATLSTNNVKLLVSAGIPSAAYAEGNLVLTFNEGTKLSYSPSSTGLIVKADDKEYELRGFNVRMQNNKATVDLNDPYAAHIKAAIEEASKVEIKYVKKYGESYNQLRDNSRTLIDDFGYITVVK